MSKMSMRVSGLERCPRWTVLTSFALCISACGGGGGSPNASATGGSGPPSASVADNSGGSGGGADGSGGTAAAGGVREGGAPDSSGGVSGGTGLGGTLGDASVAGSGDIAPSVRLGEWAGNTSEGELILFTLGADGLTQLFFGYEGDRCRGGQAVFSSSNTPVAPIADGGFTVSGNLSGTTAGSFAVTGQFTSRSSASGTVTFDIRALLPGSACDAKGTATWTAAAGADADVQCRLSACGGSTEITFFYSCATSNSTTQSRSGATGTTLKVTYSNKHVVDCQITPSDGGSLGTCSDDTGATCSW
jgi:hypothetical protein